MRLTLIRGTIILSLVLCCNSILFCQDSGSKLHVELSLNGYLTTNPVQVRQSIAHSEINTQLKSYYRQASLNISYIHNQKFGYGFGISYNQTNASFNYTTQFDEPFQQVFQKYPLSFTRSRIGIGPFISYNTKSWIFRIGTGVLKTVNQSPNRSEQWSSQSAQITSEKTYRLIEETSVYSASKTFNDSYALLAADRKISKWFSVGLFLRAYNLKQKNGPKLFNSRLTSLNLEYNQTADEYEVISDISSAESKYLVGLSINFFVDCNRRK